MSQLTDKISVLQDAAQRYEQAQQVIAVLHDAVAFAHQEVKDALDGNTAPLPAPAAQPEPEPVQEPAPQE